MGDGSICTAGFAYNDVARIQIYFQLDYQQCQYGVLGLAIPNELNESPAVKCEWQTYYVNKPIIDIELAEGSGGETYRGADCLNRDIPRYDA